MIVAALALVAILQAVLGMYLILSRRRPRPSGLPESADVGDRPLMTRWQYQKHDRTMLRGALHEAAEDSREVGMPLRVFLEEARRAYASAWKQKPLSGGGD